MDKGTILNRLHEIYNLARHTGDFEQVIEKLTGEVKINSLVSYYTNRVEEFDDYDKNIIDMIIRILQEVYNNSDLISPVSDEDYDKLYEINREINKEEIVGAGNPRDKIISSHSYPDLRGTLDKVHFIKTSEKGKDKRKSLEEWIRGIENKLGRKLYEQEAKICMFPKWDGLSVVFECEADGSVNKALTRGDTTKNEAVELTPMFKEINLDYLNDFNNGRFGVKTEIVMTQDNFKALKEKYGEFKSPRSAVSSILNSKELDKKYLRYLTIIPLQIQNYETKEIRIPEEVFNSFPYYESNLYDFKDIKEGIETLKQWVEKDYGIPIDGIVLRLMNKGVQKLLGREDNINKYEVAYKLPPEQKRTTLKDVEFSVGVLGAITPVAKIEPVKLKGNKISSISLGSVDRFESLDLREGDEVIIKYDVIPYLDKDETCKKGNGRKFETPKVCPFCKEPLMKDPVLKCVNINCESRMIGKIMNYVTKMSIPNISIGIITALFKNGYLKSIEDLYTLQKHKKNIVRLEGFGEKLFQKIIDGIESRKSVYDYQLLGSIGIPDVGEKIFKKVLTVYTLDELIEICTSGKKDKLKTIEGIKDKTAEKIILGIIMNEELINYLCRVLDVKRDDRKYTIKVAFTKVRDKDFEKFLDEKGVLVLDNYNKNVDILIVKDKNTESSKVTKARKDGKEIITIDEAYKLFGYSI